MWVGVHGMLPHTKSLINSRHIQNKCEGCGICYVSSTPGSVYLFPCWLLHIMIIHQKYGTSLSSLQRVLRTLKAHKMLDRQKKYSYRN